MRTKTIVLTAALFAAGLGVSMAQAPVYSVNAVGYVTKALGNGYTLISNPLNGTNNLLSTILPVVPDGTFVLKWDVTAQGFAPASQYYDGLGWLPDNTLNPGEGAFINVSGIVGTTNITFVGEVPQGPALTNALHANYTLASSIVPQSISLADSSINLLPVDGDFVLFWNYASQSFAPALQYYDGLGWLPNEPVPAVGEGFFYNTGAGRNWIRAFSVN